jgi:hypothetical protein
MLLLPGCDIGDCLVRSVKFFSDRACVASQAVGTQAIEITDPLHFRKWRYDRRTWSALLKMI